MFWVESWNIILNFCTFSARGCWGQPMSLFWKLVDETQMAAPREYTDAFIIIKKLFLGGLWGPQSNSPPKRRLLSHCASKVKGLTRLLVTTTWQFYRLGITTQSLWPVSWPRWKMYDAKKYNWGHMYYLAGRPIIPLHVWTNFRTSLSSMFFWWRMRLQCQKTGFGSEKKV